MTPFILVRHGIYAINRLYKVTFSFFRPVPKNPRVNAAVRVSCGVIDPRVIFYFFYFENNTDGQQTKCRIPPTETKTILILCTKNHRRIDGFGRLILFCLYMMPIIAALAMLQLELECVLMTIRSPIYFTMENNRKFLDDIARKYRSRSNKETSICLIQPRFLEKSRRAIWTQPPGGHRKRNRRRMPLIFFIF